MTDIVLVLTTVPVDFGVSEFATSLVEGGHAACVSVLAPMDSTFRWNGAIESTQERQVLIKTTGRQVDGLEAAVRRMHPYDLPEFLVVPVSGGGEGYLHWISSASV